MSWFLKNATGSGSLAQSDATASANSGQVGGYQARVLVYTVTSGGAVTLRATGAWRTLPTTLGSVSGTVVLAADYAIPAGGWWRVTLEVNGGYQRTWLASAADSDGKSLKAGTHTVTFKGVTWYDDGAEVDYCTVYFGNQQCFINDTITQGSTPAPAQPSVTSAASDAHGGVTLTVQEGDAYTEYLRLYRSATSGGTFTEVVAPAITQSEGASGVWTVFDPRPDLVTGLGQFSGTIYYRVVAHSSGGDSAYASTSVTRSQNRAAVLASRADDAMGYALSLAMSGVPQYVEKASGTYKSAPLMVRAQCYKLNTSTYSRASILATIEAQWDYLKTFSDANGIVKQISDAYPNQLSADAHYRACFHAYAAAMLLKSEGETTLSAEMLSQVDIWAVNYLTYCKLLNDPYGGTAINPSFAYSNDNGATWISQLEPNQQLWGAMLLSCLYNDPYSDLYHSTATYASRTGGYGPYTIPQIVNGIIDITHRSQLTTAPVGFLPHATGLSTGYHLASMISLVSILSKFGAGWNTTLEHVLDQAYSCMTTGDARFYDPEHTNAQSVNDFEWNDERNYLYEQQSTYTDPFPLCNWSWTRHNYDDEHAGSYGKYHAADDYVTDNPWFVSIDGMLLHQTYVDVLWAPPPEVPFSYSPLSGGVVNSRRIVRSAA